MESLKNSKERELSIIDLWFLFRNHLVFIISTTLIIFSIFFIYTFFFMTTKYISNADVMIQVEQTTSQTADPNYDLVNAFRLIDTVAELMEKEVVLDNALVRLEQLGYEDISISLLRKGLIVNSSSTSYFINISFVDEDTQFAERAVNAVIDAVIEETDKENAFPVLTDKIRRTSFASDSEYYSPNRIINLSIGLLLGITISYGFIILREFTLTYFRSKEEVETTLNLQVLGVIPVMTVKEKTNEKK